MPRTMAGILAPVKAYLTNGRPNLCERSCPLFQEDLSPFKRDKIRRILEGAIEVPTAGGREATRAAMQIPRLARGRLAERGRVALAKSSRSL